MKKKNTKKQSFKKWLKATLKGSITAPTLQLSLKTPHDVIKGRSTGDQLNEPDVGLETNLRGFSPLSSFKQAEDGYIIFRERSFSPNMLDVSSFSCEVI